MISHPAKRLATLTLLTALLAFPAFKAGAQSITDESVRPIIHGGEFAQIRGINRETFGLVNQRLALLRPARGSGEEDARRKKAGPSRELETWWQFFGQSGDQARRQTISGYDAAAFGIAAGMDKEVSDKTVLGASFAWGASTIDVRGAGTPKSELDSYLISLYGDYDTGRFYVNGALSVGYNKVATTKSWAGAQRNGDYGAGFFNARGEAGYAFMRSKTRIIPKLIGEYSYYVPRSYTEEGAAAQHVTYSTLDSVEVGGGLDLNWLYKNGEGSYWVPAVSFAYRYDLTADAITAETQFVTGGPVYQIEGFTPASGTFDFGAGLTYYSEANWELLARYDLTARQDYVGHAGMLRAAYKFY